MGRECSTHDREEFAYKVLIGKPEGNRPLGRPRCRREDIKVILKKLGTSDGLL
jgi:hypothetical protein